MFMKRFWKFKDISKLRLAQYSSLSKSHVSKVLKEVEIWPLGCKVENHLHLVAQSDNISKSMQKFKAYTAYELLELLKRKNATRLLK